jgi:methionyl-tRNA formyltransferase
LLKVALIGRTKFLLNTGEYLIKNGIKVELIITSKNSKHDTIGIKEFKKFAKKSGAKFYNTENINSEKINLILKKSNIHLGISVNNLLLIKKEVIDLFKFGILNAHAGDLPRYRGNACPNWAIINNEKNIGLSIHYMVEEVDAGDILLKKKFKINSKTTIEDFYKFGEKQIPIMFYECIKKIQKNKITKIKQNEKNILRTFPRNKIDGKINWNKSINEIDRLIRASGFPFFGAYSYFNNSKLIILKAEINKPEFAYLAEPGQVVSRNKDGSISIACKNGFIKLNEVIYKNKIFKKPSELIKSIHTKLGMDIESEIEKINEKLDELLKIPKE